jgi:ABC-type sugar transport system ATPase subunit
MKMTIKMKDQVNPNLSLNSNSNSSPCLNSLVPLHVKNLKKRWPDFELNAHFSVGVKERVVLSGKSGGGKSTLLRMIAGLDTGLETSSEAGLEPLQNHQDQVGVFLGEKNLNQIPTARREIGFVFQDPALFPTMNVLDNVTFGLRVRGVGRVEREKQALPWLEKIELQSKLLKPVTELSGGEKQRVAFIRAVIWRPQLLLLDEPFSALDPQMRKILQKELVELHQLWPAPMLFVTHDESDLSAIATRRLSLEWDGISVCRNILEQ